MPAEFLRTVAEDRKRTFRLSMLPVSIAAHAGAGLALLIMPLAAEVERPPVARIVPSYMSAIPVPPPPPPPSTRPPAVVSPSAAPTTAPSSIEPEVDRPPAAPPIPGVIGGTEGPGDPRGFGTGALILAPPPPPPPPPPVTGEPSLPRVGSGIRTPKRVAGNPPEYPSVARMARVEGLVILEATISEEGLIDRVRVLRSVPLLDEAAIAAVKRWRYTPTLLNGKPVAVLMTITVEFKLRD